MKSNSIFKIIGIIIVLTTINSTTFAQNYRVKFFVDEQKVYKDNVYGKTIKTEGYRTTTKEFDVYADSENDARNKAENTCGKWCSGDDRYGDDKIKDPETGKYVEVIIYIRRTYSFESLEKI